MHPIVIVGKHAIRIFDYFQFSLFDFPYLSSFNACEELDHLIILYPLSPALMSIGGDIVPPPNYYGGAALACKAS